MNRRIIALRGRGGIGKTTTINMLADMLLTRGWTRESRVLHGNGIDITDVYFGADGVRLGVASAGDNFREVNDALKILSGAGCVTVICACRTRGATNDAMRKYSNNITFVNKTIVADDDVAQAQTNESDANRILGNL